MNKEARALLCTVSRLLPTPHQRHSFHVQTAAFLDADGDARPAHAQGKSPASLSRFLNLYAWNAREVIRAVRSAIRGRVALLARQRRGRKPVLEVLVDSTCLEKVGEFPDLEIHRLNGKLGLHLVVLYVLVGGERFPWSFRVWRGKGEASQPALALRMLAQLPQS